MEERRYLEERRPEDRRFDERRREERRFGNERRQDNPSYRNEGRNYRQELLERFADMDFEDHHEYRDHQRYFE